MLCRVRWRRDVKDAIWRGPGAALCVCVGDAAPSPLMHPRLQLSSRRRGAHLLLRGSGGAPSSSSEELADDESSSLLAGPHAQLLPDSAYTAVRHDVRVAVGIKL